MPDNGETACIVEALLFVSGDPLTMKELVKATGADSDTVTMAVRILRDRYIAADSALQVIEIAGGYQMATRREYAPFVGKLLAPHANRLSKPALETATIVAYRQPCTQADIEAVRGVSSDGVLKTLLERELIAEAGRKQAPGRPLLYQTTTQFLHYFGLTDLRELPPLETDDAADAADRSAADTALLAAGVALEDAAS